MNIYLSNQWYLNIRRIEWVDMDDDFDLDNKQNDIRIHPF